MSATGPDLTLPGIQERIDSPIGDTSPHKSHNVSHGATASTTASPTYVYWHPIHPEPWDDTFELTWVNRDSQVNQRDYFDRPRKRRVWGHSPYAAGTFDPSWSLASVESPKQAAHRRQGLAPPGVVSKSPSRRQAGLSRTQSLPAARNDLASDFDRRMAQRRPTMQNRIMAQSFLSVKKRGKVDKPTWDPDFHLTYSERFNENLHPNFRQYFGAHIIVPDQMVKVEPHRMAKTFGKRCERCWRGMGDPPGTDGVYPLCPDNDRRH